MSFTWIYLRFLESMSIKPTHSNDGLQNLNAPKDVINIQTHYESIYLKENKKITFKF